MQQQQQHCTGCSSSSSSSRAIANVQQRCSDETDWPACLSGDVIHQLWASCLRAGIIQLRLALCAAE
jgi:hypothetical protein